MSDLNPSDDAAAATRALASPPPLPVPTTYFGLDNRRVSFREFLFETKNPLTLLLAVVILKILRIPLPPGGSTDDPTVDRLAPFESSLDGLTPITRAPAIAGMDALVALGFVGPIVHVVSTPLQSTEHAMITLRAPDGRSVARSHVRVSHLRHPPRVKPFVELITPLADGRFVWTANGVRDTTEPASCGWDRRAKLGVAEVVALHAQRLAALPAGAAAIVPTADADAVRRVVDAHHAEVVAFHRKRGVFTKVDPAAVAALSRVATVGGDVSDAPVLVEIDRQLNKGGSWQASIVLFAVTLFAFVALGANRWGGSFVAMLVPILLVHELGHYVAMRAFGYRNVRMFFLPLIGAAVSGRSFNVSAWRQAIVALAGPVPGILIAIPIGLIGLVRHVAWMDELALTTLALNGFNLLPILPLDGGRVAQLLIFRRTPMLDVTFRVIAVFGVLGLAFVTGERFLGYFAIGLALSVPLAVRVAAATGRMRARHPAPIVVPDGATGLPPDVAHEIIGELKAGRRRPVATKVLATQVLEVFDALNSRSPRWPATIGLGAAHVGAIGLMAVSLITFAILKNPSFLRALGTIAVGPHTRLDVADVAARRGPAYRAAARHDVVVATMKDSAASARTFATLSASLDSAGAICRLGPSIVVESPADDVAARDAAFDALETAGGKPEVGEGGWASITLVARATDPAAADAVVAAVGGNPPDGLVPPWIDVDPRPSAVRAANERARRTDAILQRVQSARMRATLARFRNRNADAGRAADPEQQAIDAANRRRNKDEVKRLYAERSKREHAEEMAAFDAALAAAPASDVEPAYVELWRRIHSPAADDEIVDEDDDGEPTTADPSAFARIESARRERTRREDQRREMLGTLPRDGDRPDAASIVWWCDANASDEERIAKVTVSQRSPAVTLPVIARWFDARSNDVRFEVRPAGDWVERRDEMPPTTRPATRAAG